MQPYAFVGVFWNRVDSGHVKPKNGGDRILSITQSSRESWTLKTLSIICWNVEMIRAIATEQLIIT